jgi:hypothetical protein
VKPLDISGINKRQYMKKRINELATNSTKNIGDLYTGINEFKRAYLPRNNLVRDENSGLLADSHNILNRWKNYFSQLLNVNNVSDVPCPGGGVSVPTSWGVLRLPMEDFFFFFL